MMKFLLSHTLHLAAAFTMAAIFISCAKEDLEKTINSQEESISKYISSTYKDYDVIRRNGSARIIVEPGNGADTLTFGDSLFFNYAGYVFSSSPSDLFATNVQSEADKAGFDITVQPDTYETVSVLYDEDLFVSGLNNGLYGIRQGEYAIILFSARYGFYNKAVGNIPAMSALCWKIWVERIKKN